MSLLINIIHTFYIEQNEQQFRRQKNLQRWTIKLYNDRHVYCQLTGRESAQIVLSRSSKYNKCNTEHNKLTSNLRYLKNTEITDFQWRIHFFLLGGGDENQYMLEISNCM